MAVAYNTAQTPTTFTSTVTDATWSPGNFTPAAGSNRLAIVVVGLGNSSAAYPTGVTLGGQAMTRIGTGAFNGSWTSVDVWELDEAGIAAMSGSALSMSISPSTIFQRMAICFTLTGAAGTVSSVQSGAGTGTTAQASASVTSTADGLVVAGLCSDAEGGVTASHSDDGGTMKTAVVSSDTISAAQYTAGTGGTINLSWSQASTGYSVVAFNVDAFGSGGGGEIISLRLDEPVIGGSVF